MIEQCANCRRAYAPRPVRNDGTDPGAMWPRTDKEAWCGEWEAIPPPENRT